MTGSTLRLEDGLVGRQRPAGSCAEATEKAIKSRVAVARMEQCRDSNRTRIDHWVVGPVRSGLQLDGIEGVSARFDADVPGDFFVSVFFNRHPKGERLRDRLDGERTVAIASLERLAVGSDDANAKVIGVGPSQFRYVCGDFPVVHREIAVVQVFNNCLQLVCRHLMVDWLSNARGLTFGEHLACGALTLWMDSTIPTSMSEIDSRRLH